MPHYTSHRLTDPMLQRLSAIVAGRPHKCGVALDALIVRGLVVPIEGAQYGKEPTHAPTPSGVEALRQARHTGW